MFEDRINFGVIIRPQHFYNKSESSENIWTMKYHHKYQNTAVFGLHQGRLGYVGMAIYKSMKF